MTWQVAGLSHGMVQHRVKQADLYHPGFTTVSRQPAKVLAAMRISSHRRLTSSGKSRLDVHILRLCSILRPQHDP